MQRCSFENAALHRGSLAKGQFAEGGSTPDARERRHLMVILGLARSWAVVRFAAKCGRGETGRRNGLEQLSAPWETGAVELPKVGETSPSGNPEPSLRHPTCRRKV